MDLLDEISAIDEIYDLYDTTLLEEYQAITNKYSIGYISYPIFN